ncbi:MAG: radical SAM protein [Lachnospiraceae bacterium]|nr:radical SAM protein [Lachnospiraceae bacterium]
MAELTMRSQKKGRTVLKEVVPLDTPFVFGVFVGDICNFKCKYCIQSAPEETEEKKSLIRSFLDMDTFIKIADSAKQFPSRIKTVMLSSIGEPLLNPNVPDMLAYMNKIDLADNYEIVTNASRLSKELSKALIDSGLTRLCISMQGITKEKYKEICGYDLDFEELYNNIKFFYDYGRGKCKLHIKTVDISLDEGEDKKFLEIFSPICDTIFIDKVMPVFKGVDYNGIVKDVDKFTNDKYKKAENVCCSPIFYRLYVLADGTIAPCCENPQPITFGNIKNITLQEAWNGAIRKKFLIQHLEHRRCENEICVQCVTPLIRTFEEDILDGYEDEIKERVSKKNPCYVKK